MKLGPYPTAWSDVSNAKRNQEVNMKAKTIKFSEGNLGAGLQNVRFDNGFLAVTPKAQVQKKE